MKIKLFLKELVVFSFVVFVFSCSTDDGNADGDSATAITVSSNVSTAFVGEAITFNVVNNLGVNVTSNSQFKIDGVVIANPHTFNSEGVFEVTATNGGLSDSTFVTIEVAPIPNSITLSVNKDSFWFDDNNVVFNVMDDLGNNLSGIVTYSTGTGYLTNPATFTSGGIHNVVAEYILPDNSTLISNAITLTAVESTHTTKVMVEDYTGTWCQYCPRLAYALEQAVAANDNIIPVAIHDDNQMLFPFASQMESAFGITGFPQGRVNRTIPWDESTSQPINLLNIRQNMGLAINSSITNNTISAEVKVHYDLKYENSNRIVVYLLENGLVYPQTNYYNGDPSSPYYQQGNPIVDFVHNHTARTVFTSVFGDVIPSSDTDTGSTYVSNYTLSVPASVQNTANLEIVAFVVDSNNKVLNVQKADLGENKEFD